MQNTQLVRGSLASSPVARGMLDIELHESQYAVEAGDSYFEGTTTTVDVSDADGLEGMPALQATSAEQVVVEGSAGAADDADLANRIARLWDTVPDELRELMAQSGTSDADATASGRAQRPDANASSSQTKMDMAAAMSTAAGIDALLAPLLADYPLQSKDAGGTQETSNVQPGGDPNTPPRPLARADTAVPSSLVSVLHRLLGIPTHSKDETWHVVSSFSSVA